MGSKRRGTESKYSYGHFRKIIADEHKYVREVVGSNTAWDIKRLEIFSKSEDQEIRKGVASNKKATSSLLALLSDDAYDWVRVAVGCNSNTSEKVLKKLLKDEYEYARTYVASNEDASGTLLQEIYDLGLRSNFSQDDARILIARHPNAPIQIIDQLIENKDSFIRSQVARNPSLNRRQFNLLIDNATEQVFCHLLSNSTCPIETLIEYAESKNIAYRASVALNSRLPENLMKVLSKSKSSIVKRRLTENENISSEILEQLSSDKNEVVRNGVLRNVKTSKEVLSNMLRLE